MRVLQFPEALRALSNEQSSRLCCLHLGQLSPVLLLAGEAVQDLAESEESVVDVSPVGV